jgi:uncharacterized protein
MKVTRLFQLGTLTAALVAGLMALDADAQTPKKLLVVTTTLGFRHSSIPTAEKVLGRLAQQSGAFTVDYVQQPEQNGREPRKPAALKADASEAARQQYQTDLTRYEADLAQYKAAQGDFNAAMKKVLEKLSPENLKNYDGVIFANTTGDLPLPDREGFLNWIKSGKAFVGMHSCSDTFHGWPPFLRMLGGEFAGHGAQVGVECLNQDAQHPSTVHLGPAWKVSKEEMYLMKNYDLDKCNHDLLVLDKHPNKPEEAGKFPVTWCKPYGEGRVFYTSLGHREDIWDEETPPNFKRENSKETSLAYQKHILEGIKWALGLSGQAKQ